jgi:hypothetical protein
MKIRWGNLGGQLGIGYCLAGVVLIFLGWNGTASYDRVTSQVPYIVSGGLAGLALVVIGAGLMIVQAQRADRASLQATVEELRDALDRIAATSAASGNPVGASAAAPAVAADEVLGGPSSYHRPDCRLVEGQAGLVPMTIAAARDAGLDPCRICAPA